MSRWHAAAARIRGDWRWMRTQGHRLRRTTTWRRFEPALVTGVPFALLLGLALGLGVLLGANLSNSFPSEQQPHGWPGPASFSNGVAMDRSMFLLAATVPGLLLGITAFRGAKAPTRDVSAFMVAAATHVGLIFGGAYLGAGIGAWAASETAPGAVNAFAVSHALLAGVFYAFGTLAAVALGPIGPAAGGTAWILYVVLYENATRWKVLREMGYAGLQAGAFPGWFFLAQALSPVAAYRGLLIIWHPPFRNWEEQAILGDAALPAWMTPRVLGLVLALWILVPLLAAAIFVAVREWRTRRASPAPVRGQPHEGDVELMDPGPIMEGPTVVAGRPREEPDGQGRRGAPRRTRPVE